MYLHLDHWDRPGPNFCQHNSSVLAAYFVQNIPGARLALCTWVAFSVSFRRRDFSDLVTDLETRLIRRSKSADYLERFKHIGLNLKKSEATGLSLKMYTKRRISCIWIFNFWIYVVFVHFKRMLTQIHMRYTDTLHKKHIPIISTTLNVSITGSITSSGIRTSLLFWMFNVSREFKFSKAIAGNTLMLYNKTGKKIWIKHRKHFQIII